jgi:hypothetical protein
MDGSLLVDDHGGHHEVIEHLALRLQDGLLHRLLLLDRPQDAREHLSGALLQLGDRQVDGDDRAVLKLADDVTTGTDDLGLVGLEVVLDVAVVLLGKGRRHEDLDVAADDVRARVAKELLGLFVF